MLLFQSLRRQLEKNDDSLTISLGDDPPKHYFPGQTLSGWVGRRAALGNGEATVTIQLAGSSRVKVFQTYTTAGHKRRESSVSEHDFTGLGDQVCIFKGPVQDIPGAADDQQWTKFPFTITIPKEPFAPHNEDEKQGETTLSSENTPLVLPASYEKRHVDMISKTADLNVGYRIDAKLSVEPGKSWSTHLSLNIRTAASSKPTTDFHLTTLPTLSVRSPRLVPGQENASIGFRVKAKRLFGSSKIPTFAFVLTVKSPTVIQLDHDTNNPFSFQIHATPDWSKTSESIAKATQKPIVQSFKLHLLTRTYMSANNPPRSLDDTNAVPLIDYTHGKASWKPEIPLTQAEEVGAAMNIFNDQHQENPPAPAAVGTLVVPLQDDAAPLDLGRTFPCGLDTETPRWGNLPAGFVLPNVRVSHSLLWELKIELAGEVKYVTGEQAVTVINPSAEKVYY